MTNLAEHPVLTLRHSHGFSPCVEPETRAVQCQDRRWPAIVSALRSLRAANRHSVRIIDTDCGTGELLLCSVRQASALGFTAIEARGIDNATTSVRHAQQLAARLDDPAIGISFEVRGLADALAEECDFPADIVVAHDTAYLGPVVGDLLKAAGRLLIVAPDEPVDLAA